MRGIHLLFATVVLLSGCAAEVIEPDEDGNDSTSSGESGETGSGGSGESNIAPAPDPGCSTGTTQTCVTAAGDDGVQTCVEHPNGEPQWGECTVEEEQCMDPGDGCTPGDTRDCGAPCYDGLGRQIIGYGTQWCEIPEGSCAPQWGDCEECVTPLVLSFDGATVGYTGVVDDTFDLGRGARTATDWPNAGTPWLALDRDGNGRIDDGGELFGSGTRLMGGGFATNGFMALRELDDDGDDRFTRADVAWPYVLVWSDHDADRTSSLSELATLDSLGITAIDLDYVVDRRCDARGNCEVERSRFSYRDATGAEREGAMIDVHLAPRR